MYNKLKLFKAHLAFLMLLPLASLSAHSAEPVSVSALSDDGNVPSNTLDNDLNTRWSALGDGQWIQYDLGTSYSVDALKISFFRGDQRTAHIAIQVSTDSNNWITLFDGDQPNLTTALQTFDLNDTQAQYVRIVGHGNSSNNWNSLTEVEIDTLAAPPTAGTNLALGKATTQSSTDHGGSANRAVDGNTSGIWGNGSITHTANSTQPWWQVDLASVNQIDHVNIWNRTNCCSSRLSNFYVLVSDAPFNSSNLNTAINQAGVSSYFHAQTAGSPTQIDINRSGRYMRVQLAGNNPLSIAEFEVIAGDGGGSDVNCPGTFDLPSCVESMANNGGGTVILDDKTYLLTDSVLLQSNVNIQGQGSGTLIAWADSIKNTVNKPLLTRTSGSVNNIILEDFKMSCGVDTNDLNDRDRTDTRGIYITGGGSQFDPSSLQHSNVTLKNLEITQCGGEGIQLKGLNKFTGIDLDFYDNGWGTTDLWHNIYLKRVRDISIIQTSDSSGGFTNSPAGHGMRMSDLDDVYLENLNVNGNADHGIHMDNVSDFRGFNLNTSGNCTAPLGACGAARCYGSCDFNLNAPQE